MATNTAGDAVELEAMRKEDSSWHPCKVSLCSSGVGLIVEYESSGGADMIVNEEAAFNRLRIRSIPLQGDDCSLIQQGEHVLAAQTLQSKLLFFDAKVEKALRVRHSKKVHCRCTFMIRWLHHDPNGGTLMVPSSSIMKLATKSIKAHPAISKFLITIKTLSCSDIPSSPTLVVDIDPEMDLNDLLERQIEEISNLADASKKKISSEILLAIEDNRGQFQCAPVTVSKVSKPRFQVPPDHNHLKRSTRIKNKLEMEMKDKDPPLPSPSIQVELSESRSPLNPLAARAALASLMSNLPQNLEFSFNNGERNGRTDSSVNITPQHIVKESLVGSKSYNHRIANGFLTSEKVSSDSEDASVPSISASNKVVNSLISTIDMPSGALSKRRENGNTSLEIIDSCASFTCLGERKLSQPTKSNRQTRSGTKQGASSRNCDIERNTRFEEIKLQNSTNVRRFTRSTVHKEKEIDMSEVEKKTEVIISGKYTEWDSKNKNIGVLDGYVLKEKKSSASPLDAGIEPLCTEEWNSLAEKKEGKNCTVEAKSRNPINMRRTTRSAIREERENETLEDKQGLEEVKLSQHTKSISSEGDITITESTVFATEEPNSSPLDAEVNLTNTEKRSKKRELSNFAKTVKKTEGKVGGSSERSQGQKRKSTTSKQEVRFSPRLKFLPRTRSQNKS